MTSLVWQVCKELFSTSWFKIASIIGVIVFVWFSAHSIYSRGYDKGVIDTNKAVVAERQKWQNTVANIQESHETEVGKLEKNYLEKLESLNKELEKMKYNPNLIVDTLKEKNSELPPEVVVFHDRIVKGISLDKSFSQKELEKAKGYTLDKLVYKLRKNYTICKKNKVQLESLQEVIRDFQEKQKELAK